MHSIVVITYAGMIYSIHHIRQKFDVEFIWQFGES